jgi:hypothetical protein
VKARAFLSGNFENVLDFEEIFGGLLGNDGVLKLLTDFRLFNDGISLSVDSLQKGELMQFRFLTCLSPSRLKR